MATAKKASTKKSAAKKAPAKKTPAKKATPKKASAKSDPAKKATAKGSEFHLYDEGKKKFVAAEKAKEVKVPGFEDFRFFLHKSADGKGWTVSEASSGGRISVGHTQKEAKEKAAEALGKHGKDGLAKSIKQSIAKNGAAPGFKDAGKKPAKETPQVTVNLKSRVLAALVDEKKLARAQVHFDEIAKATGAPVGDVSATLMALELEHKVKSLPGKMFRLPKAEESKPSGNRGRKPNGQKSQLDAAVEILKGAKEPLTCKEIVRRMFEQKLWNTAGRTPGATLSASMQREIAKRGKESRFRKAERGLYELNG